ncbi:MAG: hypothetical protein IKF36_01625 [Bacilli bacterium]|nr:hypothetical protein [Bacilli bacterium]
MNLSFIKRIDDLGRIVIPKEIRRILKIENNETMEISLYDNKVMLKKYNVLDEYENQIKLFGMLINKITNKNVIITNRDKILYSNQDYNKKEISTFLKSILLSNKGLDNEYDLDICFDIKIKSFYYSKNIIIDSNISGMIILFSNEKIEESDKRIIDIISSLFSR